ncbi:SusC/RagA family TonB-linked outer membrane protein [Longitalea luteola]|uniref:SusC/RagA family TonB-linked outer membrane protein n=1 Tax=Longitalea luteola TaxID=2812563 RepID=UPI001F6225D6|nr:SusC/RagA family TonB-linked outer membrane protein [Longitalea luteola]
MRKKSMRFFCFPLAQKTTLLLLTACLLVLTFPVSAFQQQDRTIKGKVTDENNAPLANVSVSLQGSNRSVMTDEAGNFEITVPSKKAVLQFTSVGYVLKEVSVGNQSSLNVALSLQSKQLSDVVVTGYGRSSKRNITGSITSISSENFNQVVTGSPTQLLQGKVPGLNITRSGDPNVRPTVILRGPSTLRDGANEPLYVIDGVPGASLELVAPTDIVSIDVLKDASSTAIYGSRAANGVIMITTRRAKQGHTMLSYNPYVAIETVSNKIDMLSGDELRDYLAKNGQTLLSQYNDSGVNTNWQDEVMRTGISHNHNLAFNGSQGNALFGASINYFDNQGIVKNSNLKRIVARGNLENKFFNERLKLGVSLTNSTTKKEDVDQGALFGNMLTYMPTVSVRRPDGSFTEDFSRGGYLNPVGILANNVLESKEEKTLLTGLAEVKILKGLIYTLSISGQKEQTTRNVYNNVYSGQAVGANGRAYRGSYENTKQVIESFFNYDKSFGRHNIKLLGGYSWQQDRIGDGFGVSTQGYTNDLLTFYNMYVSNPFIVGNIKFDTAVISTLRLISYYGRINYQFDDKYLIQVSLRNDGSSAFGKNNRWGYFPAVSAGWRITQESFMSNQRIFDDLKLRAGYGVSGNSLGFDAFTSIVRYSSGGRFYLNGQYPTGLLPVQNENPDLKWESTAMTNIGLDFAVLNNRLSGSIDYYIKNTSDLIYNYPVSTTQYFVNRLTANVGKVRNTGIEVSLNATPVTTKDFNWNTSLNFAHNKNEVVSLANDKFPALTSIPNAYLGGKGQSGNWSQVIMEGQPLGTFSLWHYMGKNDAGTSTFLTADGKTIASQPLTSDYYIAGNAQPKLMFGWNNTFTYKNFDLNFFLRGVTGNKILNNTLAQLNSPADSKNNNIPQFTKGEAFTDNIAYLTSDRFLEDGTYLRMDNATLGYTLKTKVKAISRLRFYVSGNNLFTITDYRGIDPEINIGGLTPGIDAKNFYPKTRSFIIGANIMF